MSNDHDDVISFRSLAEPADGGAVGLEPAVAFLTAVQRLLSAAAKASGESRRPCYGQANRSLVRRYLEAARLGSPIGGGLLAEVHTPVLDATTEPSLLPLGDATEAPFLRQVNLRLLEAVAALASAAERFESSADVDEFRHHVAAGVSAELCDAATELLDAAGDVEVQLLPAAELPLAAAPLTLSIKLQLRHLAAFQQAGQELRVNRSEVEAQLSGRVTDLGRRDADDESATVTLLVLDPDPPARTVKVRVGPQRYDDAISAHRTNRSISVRGTMVRQGNASWIWSPVSFRLGPTIEQPAADAPDEPLPFDTALG